MDAQDAQDFFRKRLACNPEYPQFHTRSLPEPASCAAASRPDYPVRPVHPCSVYSPSPLIRPVAGKRELRKGRRSAFREVARQTCPHRTIGRTPPGARASRPHTVPWVAAQFPRDAAAGHPAGGNRMARPKQSPGAVAGRSGWRRWARLCQDLCGRDARAPGGASSRDIVAPRKVRPSLCPFVVRIYVAGSAPVSAPVVLDLRGC